MIALPRGDRLRAGDVVSARESTTCAWERVIVLELSDYMVSVCAVDGATYDVLRSPYYVRPVRLAYCRACDERTMV